MTSFTLLYYQPLHGGASVAHPEEGVWAPPADVYEAGDAVVVEVEVPGTAAAALRVVLEDDVLLVEGVKAPTLARSAGAEAERFVCVERIAGPFRRVLPLPHPVDAGRAWARLQDGLLRVTLPRRQPRF